MNSPVRAIADRRNTLALGAVLRGPLVGLTEEEIADEIHALQQVTNQARPLYIWTDSALIHHPVLKDTIERLQNLARKARRTTPYQLLAEAVEELQVRPILKARHPRGAERALANIELGGLSVGLQPAYLGENRREHVDLVLCHRPMGMYRPAAYRLVAGAPGAVDAAATYASRVGRDGWGRHG